MTSDFDLLFARPPAQYRGTPFWAWNGMLQLPQLMNSIETFRTMGFGGFFMHAREGLATDYLSDAFLDCVAACVCKAEQLGLRACLYDEDRYPSGSAGGIATRNTCFRARSMVFSPARLEQHDGLLAVYAVSLTDGCLSGWRLLAGEASGSPLLADRGSGRTLADSANDAGEPGSGLASSPVPDGSVLPGEHIWYLYRQIDEPSSWYNNQTYLNTLDPAAVDHFLNVTHERYASRLSGFFGSVIPMIFTDEPHFGPGLTTLPRATDPGIVRLSYTDDLMQTFRQASGEDLLHVLPEIIWQHQDRRPARARWQFLEHVTSRFAESFAGRLAAWCSQHHLALTGHMNHEPTLEGQAGSNGDVMRCLSYFHIPGVDILFNQIEYVTLKQAQSIARQAGHNQVSSEIYGATGWNFDFRGHKFQGDWQAVLGVTHRIHHLAWLTMAGEAKHDYPASFLHHVPWYREYPLIEDHYARIQTALSRGKPVCRIGVIHPIESMWLCLGPNDQTAEQRRDLDRQFLEVVEWLLFNGLDFDLISESILARQDHGNGRSAPSCSGLAVGSMTYEAIVVPACLTLRSTTVTALASLIRGGGQVIFAGSIPEWVDARPDGQIRSLFSQGAQMVRGCHELIRSLAGLRDLDLVMDDGRRCDTLIYQMRADGDERWLLIARGKMPQNLDIPPAQTVRIIIRGDYDVRVYDTLTGQSNPSRAVHQDGCTQITWTFYELDSLLLHLAPSAAADLRLSDDDRSDQRPVHDQSETGRTPAPCPPSRVQKLDTSCRFSLSEPNVLLLDQPEYALDQEPFRCRDDTLHLDSILLMETGYPPVSRDDAQPWTDKLPRETGHTVTLRYLIESRTDVLQPALALEQPDQAEVTFDGQIVCLDETGWYVDEAIKTVSLPSFGPGNHVLIIKRPLLRRQSIQWCYLLGSFSVRLYGDRCILEDMPDRIGFSDLVMQGFPFYGGNITYHCTINVPSDTYSLRISHYRNALNRIFVDGQDAGPIVFPPYTLPLGLLAGEHQLDLVSYGTRQNTFGPVHHDDAFGDDWCNAIVYRNSDIRYAHEYQLKPCGILRTPELLSAG